MLRNCCLQKSSMEDQPPPSPTPISPEIPESLTLLEIQIFCNSDKNVTHSRGLFQKLVSKVSIALPHKFSVEMIFFVPTWKYHEQLLSFVAFSCHCQHLFGSITPLGFKSQFGHKLQSPYSRHHRSPLTLKSTYFFLWWEAQEWVIIGNFNGNSDLSAVEGGGGTGKRRSTLKECVSHELW